MSRLKVAPREFLQLYEPANGYGQVSGGIGTVYFVKKRKEAYLDDKDEVDYDTIYALKISSDTEVHRFEAQTQKRLSKHDFIAKLYDWGVLERKHLIEWLTKYGLDPSKVERRKMYVFILMEKGEHDLASHIRKAPALQYMDWTQLALCLLWQITVMWEDEETEHLDLKTQNIVMVKNEEAVPSLKLNFQKVASNTFTFTELTWEPKIIDFGFTRNSKYVKSDVKIGTYDIAPIYIMLRMALGRQTEGRDPRSFTNISNDRNPASDLWGLAWILIDYHWKIYNLGDDPFLNGLLNQIIIPAFEKGVKELETEKYRKKVAKRLLQWILVQGEEDALNDDSVKKVYGKVYNDAIRLVAQRLGAYRVFDPKMRMFLKDLMGNAYSAQETDRLQELAASHVFDVFRNTSEEATVENVQKDDYFVLMEELEAVKESSVNDRVARHPHSYFHRNIDMCDYCKTKRTTHVCTVCRSVTCKQCHKKCRGRIRIKKSL